MPTADDKTVQDAPRETTDPNFPPAPAAAGESQAVTLQMPVVVEATPSESRGTDDATTITGTDPERTDPGGPEPASMATADTEPSPMPPMGGAVKRVDPDQLLRALSSYRRPEQAVEASASDGAAAARYSGGIHDPAAATKTSAPLPLIVVETTLPPLPPRQDPASTSEAPRQEPSFRAPSPIPPYSPPSLERHPDSWNVTTPPGQSARGWLLGIGLGVVALVVLTVVALRMARVQTSSEPAPSGTATEPAPPALPTPTAATVPPSVPPSVAVAPVVPPPAPSPTFAATRDVAALPAPTHAPPAAAPPRPTATAFPAPSPRPSAATLPAAPRTDVIRSL
jgi:hypothetical protein